MELVSFSITSRLNKKPPAPQLEGSTIMALYQARGTDGRYGEPLYGWIDCDNWDEVSAWVASNPLGSPMQKQ